MERTKKMFFSEDGQYPIYGSGGNIMGYATDYLCEAGSTILGRKGSINNPQYIEERFWNVDTAFGIMPKDDNCSKYIYYFIKSIDWSKKNTGTTLPSLTQQVVKEVVIPMPKPSEQLSIVSRLDAAFAQIDALKANAEKQLAEARALFQKALEEAMTPKEGWEEKAVSQCFKSINNGANIKQLKDASGIPITRIETLSNDKFNRDRLGYANITAISKYDNYVLNENDILMSHINSMKFLGRAVVYKKEKGESIIHGMNLLRLVPNECLSSSFAVYFFYTQCFRKQILSISHQSVNQASFNVTNLKRLIIPLPSLEIQQQIVSHLDLLSANVRHLEEVQRKTLAECDALKQAMLREVFE